MTKGGSPNPHEKGGKLPTCPEPCQLFNVTSVFHLIRRFATMMGATPQYLPVTFREKEDDCLLSDKEDSEEGSENGLHVNYEDLQRPHSRSRPRTFAASIYLLIFLLTNLTSITSTYWYSESYFRQKFSQDFAGTDKIFPGLDRSLSLVTFSNHVPFTTSRWTAPPSREVDHAWNELGARDTGFLLPGKVGRKYGLDPRKHVYAPRGTLLAEDDGFPVFIQGLHDVHCLNELRRALYFNKPYYRQFENDTLTSEPFRRSHINHCLDNIRESLMCTASAGVIPGVWTGGTDNWPLFGREHKCHSYEALLEWNRKWHGSERERAVDWTVRLPAPDDAVISDILENIDDGTGEDADGRS